MFSTVLFVSRSTAPHSYMSLLNLCSPQSFVCLGPLPSTVTCHFYSYVLHSSVCVPVYCPPELHVCVLVHCYPQLLVNSNPDFSTILFVPRSTALNSYMSLLVLCSLCYISLLVLCPPQYCLCPGILSSIETCHL